MGKNLGASASLITLAAALVFHLSNDNPEKHAPGAVQVIAGSTTTAPAAVTPEPEFEVLPQVFPTAPGSRVCKPGTVEKTGTASACQALATTDPVEMESCAMDAVCPGKLREYLGLREADLQFLLASVPDPQLTRLSLMSDSAINSLQQAAFDSHWELAAQWLPWRANATGPTKAAGNARKRTAGTRDQQPGLLVFRHSAVKQQFDSGVLIIFLIGETPTAGLNREQFRTARAYMRALGNPALVRLAMPCFSGSILSLTQLLDVDQEQPGAKPYHYSIRSGTASNRMLVSAFPDNSVDVHGTNLNNVDAENDFVQVLSSLHIRPSEAAILIEDESAYSKNVSEVSTVKGHGRTEHSLVLRYPRDISILRNRYRESSTGGNADKMPSDVDFTLKDLEASDDGIPIFSTEKTPVEQDAILAEITGQIRRDGIRMVKVSATNVLDLLFLTKLLRVQCPDTRVLVTSPDLLFVKASQQSSLVGTLALSPYPLFFASTHWLGERPITHSSSNEEGMYYAAQLLLLSPKEGSSLNAYAWKGQPFPVSWLMSLSRQGFNPIRMMPHPNGGWFQKGEPDREASFFIPRPPAFWTLTLSLLSFFTVLLCGWVAYLNVRRNALSWSIVAPDGQHIADAYRLICLLAVLLLLVTMHSILLIPMGKLCFSSPYILQTLSTLLPVGLSGWLVREIIKKPRCNKARYLVIAAEFLVTACVIGAWIFCCYREEGKAGFFFSFRSLEMQTGSSPVLPVLLLLAALLVFALCHLVRFYFAISHRPRLFVAAMDKFFSFRMRNCRRSLNRALVAPMNFTSQQQSVLAAGAIVSIALPLGLWRATRKLGSFEGLTYDLLLLGLLALAATCLLVATIQMRMAWSALQPLLARLSTLPFRAAFTQISGIGKAGPIWAKRLNLQSLTMPTTAVTLLHNLEVLSGEQSWDCELTTEVLCTSRQKYTLVLSWLLEHGSISSRDKKRELFCTLRYLGATMSQMITEHILIEEWKKRLLPSDALAAQPAEASTELDAYAIAQSFVALQLSAFINYGVRQIQNLVFAISLAFGLVVMALNLYPTQAPEAVNRLLLICFAVLGYVLWTVLSQMERDPVLSQLGGTKEGELNRDFYIKLIGYAAVPAAGLLSSLFPSIGNFISSWLQPSLEALR